MYREVLITKSFQNDLLYCFQRTQQIKTSRKYQTNPNKQQPSSDLGVRFAKLNMQVSKKSKELNILSPARDGEGRWHFQQGFQAKFLLTSSCQIVGWYLSVENFKPTHRGDYSIAIQISEHMAPKRAWLGLCCKQDRVSTKHRNYCCVTNPPAQSLYFCSWVCNIPDDCIKGWKVFILPLFPVFLFNRELSAWSIYFIVC